MFIEKSARLANWNILATSLIVCMLMTLHHSISVHIRRLLIGYNSYCYCAESSNAISHKLYEAFKITNMWNKRDPIEICLLTRVNFSNKFYSKVYGFYQGNHGLSKVHGLFQGWDLEPINMLLFLRSLSSCLHTISTPLCFYPTFYDAKMWMVFVAPLLHA